jgi:hypothetical protein
LKQLSQRLQQDVQDHQKADLPLISYYGTGRLWEQRRLSEKMRRTIRLKAAWMVIKIAWTPSQVTVFLPIGCEAKPLVSTNTEWG